MNPALQTCVPPSRSLRGFIGLVFVLSVPFWLLGAATGLRLLPGLPASALMAICPALAAAILVHREGGMAAVAALLKRSFDFRKTRPIWYVPIVLLIPGVMVAAYVTLRLMGTPVPSPQIAWPEALLLFLAFFIAALGEELGWTGYAMEPLQQRWNALQTGVLLGLVWAVWHVMPLIQVNRAPDWIAGWVLATVASRVLMVWLYNNTGGSVFAAALYHAISNSSWMLFPRYGSHYDPRVVGVLLAMVAVAVILACGPRTLRRTQTV